VKEPKREFRTNDTNDDTIEIVTVETA